MRSVFTIIGLSAVIIGCSTPKNSGGSGFADSGLTGFIGELKGNQMPGPGRTPSSPTPLQTTIYAYELTSLAQVEQVDAAPLYKAIRSRLVDSTVSDAAGNYILRLKPGSYSIFARVKGQYFANSFDSNNKVNPVTVTEKTFSPFNITVNVDAVY